MCSVEDGDVDQHPQEDQEVIQQSNHSHHRLRDDVQRGDHIEQQEDEDEEDVEPIEQHQPSQREEVPPHMPQQDGHIIQVVNQLQAGEDMTM